MKKENKKEIISIKWLNFCIYWRIPIGILFGLSNIIKFCGTNTNWNILVVLFLVIDISTVILYILTFVFARKHTIFGYNLLYSLFIIETITYSLANAINSNFNSLSDLILTFIICLLIYGLIWFLPNHIYLKKRKYLFSKSVITTEEVEKTNKIDESEEENKEESILCSKSTRKVAINNKRFCKFCGGKINEDGNCIKCGKKYFRIKSKITTILIVIIIVSMGLNIFLLISTQNSKRKIDELKSEVEALNLDIVSLRDDNFQLTLDKAEYINKANFLDENIAFVIQGYGNYYYSYDCVQKKTNGSYNYWAYNEEAAIGKGYRRGSC